MKKQQKVWLIHMSITCRLEKIKFQGSRLKLKIELGGAPSETVFQLILRYRAKLERDQAEYAFEMQPPVWKGSVQFLEGELDLGSAALKPVFWDLYLQYDGAETGEIPVPFGTFHKKIRNPFYTGEYCQPDTGMFFHPYIKDGNMAFQFREKGSYDTVRFRLKEWLALFLYRAGKRYWDRKRIFLVYEKFCMMAQENGYYFFRYCMEQGIEKELGCNMYYILTADSDDRARLEPYKKKVVSFMSLRHMIYVQAAKLLISTDTKQHAYAWRKRHSILTGQLWKKKLVFLQHGVIGLKNVEIAYKKGNAGECNLFIVSSKQEENIIETHYGYSPKEIAVTGLARWDALTDKCAENREILVMATWRSWLDGATPKDFKNSAYYKQYQALLTSEKLHTLLKKYDVKMRFYIHSKFKDYIQEFVSTKTDRIMLQTFGEKPLNQLIMESNMLLTDYSSVSWDMFWQGKPVVFFQFDLPDYLEAHGSYMDMKRDLFGPRAENTEELLPILEQYMQNDFKLSPEYAAMLSDSFAYRDHENCRRIAAAVKEMV